MNKKEEKQIKTSDYEIKQVGLNVEAYNIILEIKSKLIRINKKHFTFSDAIIYLKNTTKGSNVNFSAKEISQIKNILKGGKQ